MKKTFPFQLPGKNDQRVVDSIKNEIRKYLKRERRKKLPEGADFWDFDCKVGGDQETPEKKFASEITEAIDQAILKPCASVYVEILAKPGHWPKPAPDPALALPVEIDATTTAVEPPSETPAQE